MIPVVLLMLSLLSPRLEMLDELNDRRERATCGHDMVETRDELVAGARQHSREMRDAGQIFHSVLEVGEWSLVGEVVGVGNSPDHLVRMLWASPPHREILLDCRYDRMAIGLVFDAGLVWMTGRLYAR